MASRYDDVLIAIFTGRQITREMITGPSNPLDPFPRGPVGEPPYADPDRLADNEAEADEAADADTAAYLAELFGDDDATVGELVEPYVPFQDVPDSWARGHLEDAPGYLESTAPYLY